MYLLKKQGGTNSLVDQGKGRTGCFMIIVEWDEDAGEGALDRNSRGLHSFIFYRLASTEYLLEREDVY